ncbi:hypothetical protein CDAR_109551 [Caerostris darwini]|uniref:Uncharacterized protein n=1 Tax=Caerostris darwini TaxID=1538125 RepID=A0AAV4SXY7_9ARAC|nr:hypothetical protein CDAR_109551 [Caerostris darwini]
MWRQHLSILIHFQVQDCRQKPIRHYPSSNNIRGIVAALAPYSAPPTPTPAEPIPGRPPGHRRSKGGAAKLSLRLGTLKQWSLGDPSTLSLQSGPGPPEWAVALIYIRARMESG